MVVAAFDLHVCLAVDALDILRQLQGYLDLRPIDGHAQLGLCERFVRGV
ncbi:MAG TPA: hypothetical protein VK680_12130 [Solirubrobacteraceae bacterium]|nr:hypothetical protein [Solirubrobacteraceae bacterium]